MVAFSIQMPEELKERLEAVAARHAVAPDAYILATLESAVQTDTFAETDQALMHARFAAIIAEAESLESEPGKPLADPDEAEYGRIIEEKYRKMGFNL